MALPSIAALPCPASEKPTRLARGSAQSLASTAIIAAVFGSVVPSAAVPLDDDIIRFVRDTPIALTDITLDNGFSIGGQVVVDNLRMDVRSGDIFPGGPFVPQVSIFPPVSVEFDDVIDFSAELFVPLDDDGTIGLFSVNPDNATVEGFNGSLQTDGGDLFVSTEGAFPGDPFYQITVEKPLDAFQGFPNGRRGEGSEPFADALANRNSETLLNAIILLQLFAGSVNLGIAVLPDGFFGVPSLLGVGELTPDDRFVIARAEAPLSAVPIPPPALLLISALGTLVIARHSSDRQRVL